MIRHTTLLFFLLAGALSIVLFSVKYKVQDLEGEVLSLDRAIAADKQAIRVLKAEWSLLNDPETLRRQATRYLGLKPIRVEQISGFTALTGMKPVNWRKQGGPHE